MMRKIGTVLSGNKIWIGKIQIEKEKGFHQWKKNS